MRLDGKVVMITGAGRSLGRSHALTFAEEGADLLLTDFCEEDGPYLLASRRELEQTAEECRKVGSTVVTAVADVRDQADIDAAVGTGVREFGRIDVLVNNAGLLVPGGVLAHELTEDQWNLVLDVNLSGTWRCSKAVLQHMVAARSGSIVNTSSTGGRVAFEMYSNYVASKHAVVGLTKALALEYARFGIRVNAVAPSTVAAQDTLGARSTAAVAATFGVSLEDYERGSAAHHPLGRLISATEVSKACVYLASDDSTGTTGTELLVDCGYTLH
jgi:azi24